MPDPPRLWSGVLRRLAVDVPAFALEAWLHPLVIVENDEALTLECPSSFHRERVRARFLERIKKLACEEAGSEVVIRLTVGSSAPIHEARQTGKPVDGAPSQTAPTKRELARVRPAASGCQTALSSSFDSFVVGPTNALAREASLALAQRRQLGVSPLYLSSPSGLGKSHLARAIVTEARNQGQDRIIYVSAEMFTSEFTNSIRTRSTAGFKRRYRQECDLLVVEDVQFLGGKTSTQLEMFHTLEHLRGAGSRVVLTADRLPRDIGRLEPRLASHMSSGLVAEMEAPDAALRRQMLRSKAAAGGVRLPDDCLDLLVDRVRGSLRDLDSVLTQLVASSTLLQRRIDRDLTEQALRKVQTTAERALEPETIVEVVATFFQTTPAALASRSRRRDVLRPRQLAMALCRRYTNASLERIGRALGREHPAVRNAIETIERAILENAPLRYQVEAIAARLDGMTGGDPPR